MRSLLELGTARYNYCHRRSIESASVVAEPVAVVVGVRAAASRAFADSD